MLHLKTGDRLPSVALVQKLINECRVQEPRLESVPELRVDGVYGRNSQTSVRAVQVAMGLPSPGGTFDRHTWSSLATIAKWRIVDVCDLALEGYLRSKPRDQLRRDLIEKGTRQFPQASAHELGAKAHRLLQKWTNDASDCRQQFLRFEAQGGQPIALRSAKQPFNAIREGLAARATGGWKVVMLRITGHGSPGAQGVAGSLFGATELRSGNISMAAETGDLDFLDAIMVGGMTMPMAPFGVIELHGCRVAQRGRPRRGQAIVDGPGFVQTFANFMARPVSAGSETQYVGNVLLDVRFEGKPITSMPGGCGIEEWFARH